MGSGNAEFLVRLGIGPAIDALAYHFSCTAKARKLKNDVFNALHEIEADVKLVVVEAKEKVAKTGARVAEEVTDKATEAKDELISNS